MQSRTGLLRLLGYRPCPYGSHLHRPWSGTATTGTITAAGAGDPAVHAEEPQGDDAEEAAKAAAVEMERRERLVREGGETEPPPPSLVTKTTKKSSSFSTSPKLESSEVPPQADPAFQQKRQVHSPELAMDVGSCVGWDGRPLVGGGEDGRWLERQEEEMEDKEYFEHHKPTPLSELEFADTRRPIRRATDSDAVDDDAGVREVPRGWREEQLDTVDEALLRAEAMFREAAERGDPDTPHGRVLANYQRMVLL